ncbi:DDE superfamily endonuclease, CENP-B-like protein, partial [Metarhizium majus ARSEF 297]
MAAIDEALKFLESSESSNYAKTARRFNCDETTLRRRHQGKQRSRRDADSLYKSRLSKQQERELVAYIHKLSSRGIPPTLTMMKNFAQDIAKIEVGRNWAYGFVKRHHTDLGCTWFDGFDIARRRADNTPRYKAYFELIRKKIEEYDIAPCNTYNMDEKGFLMGVINKTKRVFTLNLKKQGKLLGASQDGSRSWITFLACICQDLTSLPPFLIYQGKAGQVQDSWLTEFDPEHQSAFFTTSETGWTNHELGKEWLIGVFDRFTKAKARNGRDYRLLITDGHSSHINMDFLDWCDQHRIIVATAKTQGLINLSKREFWTLFWSAFEASFSPENIASGWRRTGLLPFDPEVVLSQIAKVEEEDPDTDSDSADSRALQKPTARELRRLVDNVVDKSRDSGSSARKLKSTLESLQAEVELLRYYEERERKRQVKEARKQEREVNRQIREALKESNRGISKQKQPKLQEDFNAIEENERTQDEIIVAVPPSVEMPAPSISPSRCKTTSEKKMKMTSAGIAGSKRPSLVVESAREMVVSYWDSGRPQRNSKRPRWLEDYDID